MKKGASSPWQAFKRGTDKFLGGLIAATFAVIALWLVSWAAAELINLIMVEPVQLKDGVTTGILFCKVGICFLVLVVALGIPD